VLETDQISDSLPCHHFLFQMGSFPCSWWHVFVTQQLLLENFICFWLFQLPGGNTDIIFLSFPSFLPSFLPSLLHLRIFQIMFKSLDFNGDAERYFGQCSNRF
jgi:hypothetical protein